MYLKANGDAKQWLLPIDKTVAFRHGQAHGYRFVGWGVLRQRLVRLCSGTPPRHETRLMERAYVAAETMWRSRGRYGQSSNVARSPR
jgi:hypothetical protein